MSSGYSNRLWKCPFFQADERQIVICEGGRVSFTDRPTYLRYANGYCCGDWERCTLAMALNRFYEEKCK